MNDVIWIAVLSTMLIFVPLIIAVLVEYLVPMGDEHETKDD